MTHIDPQLIRQIVERVIAQMNGGSPPPTAAPIKPPIGVCTGDYSKFTDRPDLTSPAPTPMSLPPVAAEAPVIDAPLSGFVTARHVDTIKGSVLPLAFGAKLTPLGKDRAKERKLTIKRLTAKAGATTTPAVNTWHWWIAGHCPGVDQVTANLKGKLTPLAAKRSMSHLHQAVGDLAKRVQAGTTAGGVLFTPSAAQAICYANRCPSLRASVATCGEAVEQAIAQLAANVLIVEYPHHGPQAMAAMTERFITAPRPALSQVDQHLKELATCV